ncbi:MAG: ABC transporter permease [Terracidiphilus sp.]
MSSQSNVMPESSLRSQGIAAAAIPAARLMYWSVRRELWEIRAIYVAPVAVACVFLFGFSISILHVLVKMHAAPWLDVMQQRELFGKPYEFAEDLIMGAVLLVGLFYSIDALHGERRDRSILFWKSLPVSDLTTVLSKASIPIVVLPLLAFAVAVLTQSMMLLISSAALLGSGHNVALLWSRVGIFHRWSMLLFHFVCIHGLWQAPIYAWLLLVSGWARRVPILWAVLPPLTIGIVEKVAFNTTFFGSLIGNRFTGGSEGISIMERGRAMDPTMMFAPLHFLINPGLWMGLAVTAAFLAAAVRLRRYRGPI